MKLSLFNAVLFTVLAVVQIPVWRKWRRLKFDDPFDAEIHKRFKNISRLTFCVLFSGLATFLLASRFLPGTFGEIVSDLGLAIAFGAFGVGWNIPALRSELVRRSEGKASSSKEKLMRMTSVRRALTINMPVAILSLSLLTGVMFIARQFG